MASSTPALETILCLDIGSCTQSALLFTPGCTPANAARFVLPSPSLLLVRHIAANTEARRGVYLHGGGMSSNFVNALERHLGFGCSVAIHPRTMAIFAASGVVLPGNGLLLSEVCPAGYSPLRTGDVNIGYWSNLCRSAGLDAPPFFAVAVQSHDATEDHAPAGQQGATGMLLWRDLLDRHEHTGIPSQSLVHAVAPPYPGRLAVIQAETGGLVADSGAAALLGLLCVPEIAERSHREGVVLVNAGNSHTTAFLVYRKRVFGVYEHHTLRLDRDQLAKDLADFRLGWLPNEAVLASGGHGALLIDLPQEAEGFKATYITGSQRDMLRGLGQMAAAFGDVAQTGCFGLLHGMGYL